MRIPWGVFWQKSRGRLKSAWLITAGLVAIYLGAVEPMNREKGIASERVAGLAAAEEWEPSAMWHQMMPLHAMFQRSTTEGVVGGVPGGIRAGYQ